ncbi:MAG: response regulator receiver, partial [Cyanobacteria bacterium RYN_339]|nr:response regulator receiver [Cyanobacteria bacterium RYN_339]
TAAGLQVKRLADWPRLDPDARLVLAGLRQADLEAGAIAAAADQHPTVPIVALADADPAHLLAAVRAGARDAVPDVAAAVEALSRVAQRQARLEPPTDRRQGRVVAVFALKGGVGKSLVAANLAIGLQRAANVPVTLVDLSLPCGNLDMYLDLHGPRGVADLLPAGQDVDARVIKQAMLVHESGVSLLAGARPGNAGELAACPSRPLLDALTQTRGITVVDVGAYLDEAQVGALEAADLIIVPVSPLISSAVSMPAIWEHLSALGIPEDRVLPVLNQTCPPGDPLPDAVFQQLMRGKPRHQLPWGGADVARSLDEGRPMAWFQRRHPLAKALDGLAQDVLVQVALPEPLTTPVVRLRVPGRRKVEAFWSMFQRREAAHVSA